MGISYTGGNVEKYRQGDYIFYIRQFMPFYAMRAWGELQKIIAPVIGGAVSEIKNDNMDTEIGDTVFIGEVLANALNNLALKTNGEQIERVAHILLDPQYISVAPASEEKNIQRLDESTLNEVFSGRPIDMIVLMVKIFKVNYLDFSKLSSVPTGFRNQLGEITTAFRESCPMFSSK